MRHRTLAALLALALLAPLTVSVARDSAVDPLIFSSAGFLDAHPDIKNRQLGLAAYEKGDFEEAMKLFKRAARFADKPSQGMIGEMYWRGEGSPVDRPAAYAWMDLAAERAFPVLLVKREKYWADMDEAERERAIEVGTPLYAEFGDAVAKPRLETKLRRAKSQVTGSRTGFVGALQIQLLTPNGYMTVDGSNYYHDDFWVPERYWAWQDKEWKSPPKGVVDVGPIQQPDAPIEDAPNKEMPKQ